VISRAVGERDPPIRGAHGRWIATSWASGPPDAPGSVGGVAAPDGERGTSCETAGHTDPDADLTGRLPLPRPPESSVPPLPPAPGGATAPPRRTHRWGIGAYLLVEAVFLGVSLLLGLAFVGERISVGALTVALAVPTVLAAGTAVLITRLRGNGPRADLGLVWSWHDIRVGAAYGFGGLVITVPASLLYVIVVGPERASSAIGDVFAGLRAGPVAAIGVALVVVLLAPLCEEIVYRGLLWGALERYAPPRWVPFVVTTLLFALAHFEFTRTPLLFVVALPIALARLRTGRLAASVVAHQVNNLLPGVVLATTLLGLTPVQ
jgi:membrane protease YdiL (CAAX protease family)